MEAILGVEDILRSRWDATLIAGAVHFQVPPGAGAGPADAGAASPAVGLGVNLAAADAGVRSPGWWGYVNMLGAVGSLVEHAFHWVESCQCHGSWQLGLSQRSWQAGRAEFRRRLGAVGADFPDCPLRGRRGPEMAAGDFHSLLRALAELTATGVHLTCARGASPRDAHKILAEFDQIRSSLVYSRRGGSFPGCLLASPTATCRRPGTSPPGLCACGSNSARGTASRSATPTPSASSSWRLVGLCGPCCWIS